MITEEQMLREEADEKTDHLAATGCTGSVGCPVCYPLWPEVTGSNYEHEDEESDNPAAL